MTPLLFSSWNHPIGKLPWVIRYKAEGSTNAFFLTLHFRMSNFFDSLRSIKRVAFEWRQFKWKGWNVLCIRHHRHQHYRHRPAHLNQMFIISFRHKFPSSKLIWRQCLYMQMKYSQKETLTREMFWNCRPISHRWESYPTVVIAIACCNSSRWWYPGHYMIQKQHHWAYFVLGAYWRVL